MSFSYPVALVLLGIVGAVAFLTFKHDIDPNLFQTLVAALLGGGLLHAGRSGGGSGGGGSTP